MIPLDDPGREETEALEIAAGLTPDRAFDRCWLRCLHAQAVDRLRAEYERTGRGILFETFKDLPRGARPEESQAELGIRLGLSAAAVKAAFHRFHRRQAELLREVAGETVGSPAAVEEELRHLLASLEG